MEPDADRRLAVDNRIGLAVIGPPYKRKSHIPPGTISFPYRKALSIAVGVALLPLALLSSLDYSPHVDNWQTINWFLSYQHGYVHRGLMGEIVRLFHDSPRIEQVHSLVLTLERGVIIASTLILWALLIPRIWRREPSGQDKLMFTAFAAVLLLAPIWRIFGLIAGFGDEWAFLFALLALASLIAKCPFCYICSIVVAYMFHPQGVLYAILLSMFILHAIMRNPAYARRWRTWTFAMLAPLCIIAALYASVSPAAIAAELILHKDEFLRIMPESDFMNIYNEFVPADEAKLSQWPRRWQNILLLAKMFAALFLPTLVYAALFSLAWARRMTQPAKAPFLLADSPILARLVPYEGYMITMAAAFFATPMILVGGDWDRFFHMSWLGVSLATIYLLWFPEQRNEQPPAGKKQRKKSKPAAKSLLPGIIAAVMAVWAAVFAGAPPVVFGRVYDTCNLCNDTTYFLNKNPIGEWYAQSSYDFIAYGNHTFSYTGKEIYGIRLVDNLVKPEGGKLPVPGKSANLRIFERYIVARGGKLFTVELNYEGGTTPPVQLQVNHHPIPPIHADEGSVIWRFLGPEETTNLRFFVISISDRDFRISDLSISIQDADEG